MRAVIFLILLGGAVQVAAQNNYREKVAKYLISHENQWVGGKGCNHIISKVKKKFDLVGYKKFDITPETNNLIPQVEVGDYIYHNFSVSQWGDQTGSHYEVVVGKLNDTTFILAEQNTGSHKGVRISGAASLHTCGGKIEVYGLAPRKGTGISKEKRDEYRSLRRPELASK